MLLYESPHNFFSIDWNVIVHVTSAIFRNIHVFPGIKTSTIQTGTVCNSQAVNYVVGQPTSNRAAIKINSTLGRGVVAPAAGIPWSRVLAGRATGQ